MTTRRGAGWAIAAAWIGLWAATAVVAGQPAATAASPRRIISLVPALTEMLFAIGAGPQVVAVSSFDTHPPEVAAAAQGRGAARSRRRAGAVAHAGSGRHLRQSGRPAPSARPGLDSGVRLPARWPVRRLRDDAGARGPHRAWRPRRRGGPRPRTAHRRGATAHLGAATAARAARVRTRAGVAAQHLRQRRTRFPARHAARRRRRQRLRRCRCRSRCRRPPNWCWLARRM